MGYRRRAREAALSYLYQLDSGVPSVTKNAEDFVEHFGKPEGDQDFFYQIVAGVRQTEAELDQLIEEVAENWRLSRMARVDRVVLRFAAWELKYCPDTPHRVILDEAVELAKKFSTSESASFVNGLLDKIARKLRPEVE